VNSGRPGMIHLVFQFLIFSFFPFYCGTEGVWISGVGMVRASMAAMILLENFGFRKKKLDKPL